MSAPDPSAAAAARAQAFQSRIDAAKVALEPAGFPWYAYHILGNVVFLDQLCRHSGLTLEEMSAAKPLLDVGCADGHLAFYLESLGYQVTAVDHAPTSANDMKGVRALKAALGSQIEIIDTDIDRGFTPPRRDYGLVLLLGILYHLKNPFLILETLAESADYCVLSTRVARRTPSGANIHDEPIAYLLGEDEANNDPSNFWIFSEAGLRRIIQRSGWDIRALLHSGNTRNSDPATAAGDERIYCLLSRASLFTNGRLGPGWHAAEGPRDGWRWTEPEFTAEFFASTTGKHVLEAEFYLDQPRNLKVEAISTHPGGAQKSEFDMNQAGPHTWRIPIANITDPVPFTVNFRVTGDLPSNDARALGIIVTHLHLRPL